MLHLNYSVIIKVGALLTLIEGMAMIPCVIAAVGFNESAAASALLVPGLFCILFGGVVMTQMKFKKIKLKLREGFLIACLSWFYCSAIGMLPFYFSGCDFPLIGCWFESVAGFTTTGCTVLNLDLMPKSLQLWRAICHWLGGMGILILVISILPMLGVGGRSIALAEAPGPFFAQLGTKISDTGKALYRIYLIFTVTEFLLLVIGPMDWFNALTATLSSISTGGLIITTENAPLFDNTYVRLVILLFTFLSSVNYLLFFMMVKGKWKDVLSNLELRGFVGIISVSTLLIGLSLRLSGTYSGLWQAIKDALCQVVSFISTSGYYVCDYMHWPAFTQMLLILLLLIGGCSASTSGSLKVIRFVVLLKLIKRGIFRRIHPNAVKPVMLNQKPVSATIAASITMHILLFFGVIVGGSLLLSLNNLDMTTTISTVIGIFSNTGMALGEVGASGYFGVWNGFSQFILTMLMIAGRLEMYAIILLFSRSFWQPDKAQAI